MSISPDEGMMIMQQRMAAGMAGAPQRDPGPADGAELDAVAALVVAIQANTQAVNAARPRRRLSIETCHPIPLHPISSPGAVTNLGRGDERWSPRTGWAWDIKSLTVIFGAGTTGAVVARDVIDPSGAWSKQAFVPPASGPLVVPWHPGGKSLILLPQQWLVWQSVGGGITVNGEAVEVALDLLHEYLI